MQPYPLHTRYVGHARHEFGYPLVSVRVHAIVCKLLRYHLKLLRAVGHQLPHLVENLVHGPAHVSAGHDGYGTVGAVAVAPLAYLDIGIMARGGDNASALARHHVSPAEVCNKVLVVELAVILVHLRYLRLQFRAVTLREATHHVELLQAALLLGLCKLEYGVYAFLLGILYESAGVYHGYLSLRVSAVVHAMVAACFKAAHERLAVHEILRAAHRYDVYCFLLHDLKWGYCP